MTGTEDATRVGPAIRALEQRSQVVGVKVSRDEYDAIHALAKRFGMSPSEYLRVAALTPYYASTIAGRLQGLKALAPDRKLTEEQARALFLAAKPARDAWAAVREAKETILGLEAMLAPGLLEVRRIIDELNLAADTTEGKP